MRVDLCADEIVRAVKALYARLPVPVEVQVAERMGASVASVRPQMARLAKAGVLVRDGALYSLGSRP